MKSLRAAAVLGLLLVSTTMVFAGTPTLVPKPGGPESPLGRTTESYGCYDFSCDGVTLAGTACGSDYNEIFAAAVAYCRTV